MAVPGGARRGLRYSLISSTCAGGREGESKIAAARCRPGQFRRSAATSSLPQTMSTQERGARILNGISSTLVTDPPAGLTECAAAAAAAPAARSALLPARTG